MSNNIASKNAYELLGNDPELDSDKEPEPPTKVIDKPVQRTGKRNPGADGPSTDAPRAAGGGRGGSNAGFNRDNQAGALNNRSEQRDDGGRGDRRGRGRGEHRGGERGERGGRGRGGRGFGDRYIRTNRDDRQNHSGQGEHEKQVAHGWGGEDGNSEWKDEVAGEAIAKAEANDDAGFTPDTGAGDPAFVNGPGAEGEPVGEDAMPEAEEKTKSYDEYLAEQKEKRAALGGETLQVRKANEGSKQKFPEGTAVTRNEEESFIAGSGGKARREKVNQQKKEQLQLDGQYYAAADSGESRGGRGGRGRGRGEGRGEGRGRGEGMRGRGEGGRGRGEGRGGRGRGEGYRGDRGGGFRGANRGGPRGDFNATDQSAFPALGGS